MNNPFAKACLILLIATIAFAACDQNKIYDTYVDLEENTWHIDALPTFNLDIDDSQIPYDISYNIRYADFYPYYNIYVKYFLEDSTSTIIDSELQEIILFDKKTGNPLGEGLGDILDRRVMVFPGFKFPAEGKYTFKIKQFMRTDNLPGIMSFGLRVDKQIAD